MNIPLTKIQLGYLEYLTNLINGIISKCHVPRACKNAIVVMIPKNGKKYSFPDIHRANVLLNTMAKLKKRIILARLKQECAIRRLTLDTFRAQHPSELQALRLTEMINDKLNKKQVGNALMLEISKAFDKVCRNNLLSVSRWA